MWVRIFGPFWVSGMLSDAFLAIMQTDLSGLQFFFIYSKLLESMYSVKGVST